MRESKIAPIGNEEKCPTRNQSREYVRRKVAKYCGIASESSRGEDGKVFVHVPVMQTCLNSANSAADAISNVFKGRVENAVKSGKVIHREDMIGQTIEITHEHAEKILRRQVVRDAIELKIIPTYHYLVKNPDKLSEAQRLYFSEIIRQRRARKDALKKSRPS